MSINCAALARNVYTALNNELNELSLCQLSMLTFLTVLCNISPTANCWINLHELCWKGNLKIEIEQRVRAVSATVRFVGSKHAEAERRLHLQKV